MKRTAPRSPASRPASLARGTARFERGAPLALLVALFGCADTPERSDASWWNTPGNALAEGGVAADGGFRPGTGGAAGTGGDSGVSSPGGSASGGNPGAGSPGGGALDGGNDAGGQAGGKDASTLDAGSSAGPGGGGCALKPNKDGWITNASNGAHVQGAVYTFASAGSSIVPLTTTTVPFSTGEGGKLCVKGEAAKVLNMNFSMYYGAGLAFDLCQADSMVQMKYPIGQCPLGKGLIGVNFKLSGATIPVELRVQFHETARDESTYVVAKLGQNEARFADGKVFYNAMAPMVSVDKIDAIQFAIPTNEINTTPFDFCVEDIQFVMAPGMSCAGGSTAADAGTDGAVSDGGVKDSGPGGNPNFPPITNGCSGRTTRYWDCCKPHCGTRSNVSSAFAPITTCSRQDVALTSFDTQNACQSSGSAFMCQGNAPWAVSNTLAFGFAATKSFNDVCGRCYQLQFTGQSSIGAIDPGSAALAGKTLVVQATNVGTDVQAGQFDLLIPGGGVGLYNACSTQWGTNDIGAQYGGLLATCKQQVGATNHAALKDCVMQRCTSVFGSRGLTKLEAGCRWFVEWFEVADNPTIVYKEVACPQELKGAGMNRGTSPGNQCIQ